MSQPQDQTQPQTRPDRTPVPRPRALHTWAGRLVLALPTGLATIIIGASVVGGGHGSHIIGWT